MGRIGLPWGFAIALLSLASPALAATYTWTGGGGANVNWSSPSNWGGSAPANGEGGVALVFPALAGHYASNNDRTGLQVVSIDVATQLSNGAYTFTGNSMALNGPVTMASPGSGNPNLLWQIPVALAGDVTISASGRQTQLQGPFDLGSHTLTLDAAGDIVLAGVVSGSGNLIKNNTSALTISGANTYTGSTTGNRGALYISSATAFGATGTGTTFNGGFLGFAGNTFTTAEPFVFNGGGILAYGTPAMAGPITFQQTTDVQPFEPTSVLTIGGIIGGAGGLNKRGPGLLILSNVDELYQGPTDVGGGTLRLDGYLASTSAVTVQAGAKLEGRGATQGAIVVQSLGKISPGSSPGAMACGELSMSAGAIFEGEIEGPAAVIDYDRVAVAGPINLGGATLSLSLSYSPSTGQEFALITHLQTQPVSGSFADLAEGATFQVGATTFGITYRGGDGNDVVLVAGATPAPTATPTAEEPTGTPSEAPPEETATPTELPMATATGSHTAEPASATPTITPTPTPSLLPTSTATEVAGTCTGDCGDDHAVTVDEIVFGVKLSLDAASAAACPRFDTDPDDRVTLAEILRAVDNALAGCTP